MNVHQGQEEQDPSAAQPESSEGTSEEEPHADWEVMQPPLAASAMTSRYSISQGQGSCKPGSCSPLCPSAMLQSGSELHSAWTLTARARITMPPHHSWL